MADAEAGGDGEGEKKPWWKMRYHPLIYILFILNWVEFCLWWVCMTSAQWKVGPFPDFMAPSEYWESSVYFGPWFTCAVKYKYDAYSVWDDPLFPKPVDERFVGSQACWGSVKYKNKGGSFKNKFEAMVGFGGGILIGVMVCAILWILWIVFDVMSAMIRSFILPIIRTVQCFCCIIMIMCMELLSGSAANMWAYYFAIGMMVFQAITVVLQWMLACCIDKLDCCLCRCCGCCVCCPDDEDAK